MDVTTFLRGAAAVALAAASGVVTARGGPRPPARGERADLVVAQDGSGDATTVQAALDAIPPGNDSHRIILVRAGTYREKLFVRASHVSIVGEDRVRTRIEFAELRRLWRETHPDDWGAAVVNIGDGVTDLVLANLTIHNNYGALHGDRDHQFAIRGGAGVTRVTLLDVNAVSDGGDTVSLWNPESGLYYHANSYFEGWVDYVCPRGWCYITNSRFVGHSQTASLWHDGSAHRDAKLVVRRSTFDGDPGFALGRNNRDGQFFVLDCLFGRNMADRAMYLPSPRESYQWGERYFYANDHRDGGDFAWFADNLQTAPDAPAARDITPAWTFGGRWDPTRATPAVLPFAAIPVPEDHAADVPAGPTVLRWTAGRNATAHIVRFGEAGRLRVVSRQAAAEFRTAPLSPQTTYSWRVDEVTPRGIVAGPAWQFRTY
jgi:pectin methylesterase-like acyl-CoA thioesterase